MFGMMKGTMSEGIRLDSDGMLDLLKSFVGSTYNGKEMDIPPMWFIQLDGDRLLTMPTPWNNDHEKDVLSKVVRKIAKQMKAIRIGFISETWVATMPKETLLEVVEQVVPSQFKDRTEAFLIIIEDKEATITATWTIDRDANGIGHLGEWKSGEWTAVSGRMTGMLKDDEPEDGIMVMHGKPSEIEPHIDDWFDTLSEKKKERTIN